MKISRRSFVQHMLISSATLAGTRTIASTTNSDDRDSPTPENLMSTPLIQANHPRIVALAKEITRQAETERAAAILLHNWVRDYIQFGIPRGFYETSATETLDAKVGYCNTKVTLFSALLRARAIPTRIRVVDLSAEVLYGLFDPGTPYVDHSLAEVFLDGRWLRVDSYAVDMPLARAATKKLVSTKRKAGFGIHSDGRSDWDGRHDNFIQYMNNESIQGYVLKDHGLFADVADFYQKAQNPRNRKTIISSLGIQLSYSYVNKQIDAIRMAGNEP
jgi:transglutaminase-like putative cysteine protease